MTGMSTKPILRGGIIAAGEGSRLRAGGWRVSKPMVQVAGRPLIEHTLERFQAIGIRRLTVIIGASNDDCRQWLEGQSREFDIDLIVRTTPSSYASFSIVCDRLAGAQALITTVDSIMPLDDFRRFVAALADFPQDAVVLGLTDFVDDETPLWATLDPANGRVRQLGADSGTHVTTGLYVWPAQPPALPHTNFARLRDYLAWLVAADHPVYGVVLPCAFDIDRAQDIARAEQSISTNRSVT